MDFRNEHGSSLTIVLIFSVFALITTSTYLISQWTIARPGLLAPSSFQALLNARSGIWKAMELMNAPPVDTLAHINTLNANFNDSLFGKQSKNLNDSVALPPDDTTDVSLFSTDSFGTCKALFTYMPCFKSITSNGFFRSQSKTVSATLGGILHDSPDTVCFLGNKLPPEGGGIIDGKVAMLQDSNSLPPPSAGKAVPVVIPEMRITDLVKAVSYFKAKFSSTNDSLFQNTVLTIQDNDKLSSIKDIVNGPLLLDGSHHDLFWKEKRRVMIMGDLQITGTVTVENIEFLVSGEVKLFDDCVFKNVSIFCSKTLTITDKSVFSGNAVSLTQISINKRARIDNKSVLVAYTESKPAQLLQPAQGQQIPQQSQAGQQIKLLCSVFLTQDVRCDGTIIAYGDPSGIKTDRNVIVRGSLWSSSMICNEGAIYGFIRCKELISATELDARQKVPPAPASGKNFMTGSVRRLETIADYPYPFFMGKPSIIRWEDGM